MEENKNMNIKCQKPLFKGVAIHYSSMSYHLLHSSPLICGPTVHCALTTCDAAQFNLQGTCVCLHAV